MSQPNEKKPKHNVKFVKHDNLILYLNNINGFESKKVSLDHIVNVALPNLDLEPTVINLVETKAKYGKEVDIRGFSIFQRNRKDRVGRGNRNNGEK